MFVHPPSPGAVPIALLVVELVLASSLTAALYVFKDTSKQA
jgi:hypothetical protein